MEAEKKSRGRRKNHVFQTWFPKTSILKTITEFKHQ